MSETHNQLTIKAWLSSIQQISSTKKETWVLVRTKTVTCRYHPTSRTLLTRTTWLTTAKAFRIEWLMTYIQMSVRLLANTVSINWNKRPLLSLETLPLRIFPPNSLPMSGAKSSDMASTFTKSSKESRKKRTLKKFKLCGRCWTNRCRTGSLWGRSN